MDGISGEAYVYITDLGKRDIKLPEGVELVMPCQTHTDNVRIVTTSNETFPDTDGLISFDSSIAVGIRTADCQPVLLFAPDIKAVAAVHAGWRGTLGHITRNAVLKMIGKGASPGKMTAILGPSICGDCYEVSEELAADFRKEGFRRIYSKNHLDLKQLNSEELEAIGVKPENITVMDDCTRHTQDSNHQFRYPSWRRTPGTTDRLISLICLLPS